VRRSEAHYRGLESVSESGLSHLRQPTLMNVLLGRLRDVIDADSAAILLLDAGERYLIMYATQGAEEAAALQVRIPVGEGVVGQIVASGEPLLVNDLHEVAVADPFLREHLRSLVGAPLQVEGHVFGAIHVDSTEPRHFVEADIARVQEAADRIALALDRARLYQAAEQARQEAQQLARRLEAMQAITDEALLHTSMSPLINGLMARVRDALDADNVAILLPMPDGRELTLFTAHGPEAALADRVRVPMGRGVAGTIAATRAPLVLDDVSKVEVANPFLHEQVASLVGVPILVEQRLIGVIHVDSFTPRHFTQDDLRLLQLVADRVGLAIDRARIYEKEQQARAGAEEYARKQDEFLGIASHELRTPLTSMTANLQMARRLLKRQRSQVERGGTEKPASTSGAAEAGSDLSALVDRLDMLIERTERSTGRLVRLVNDLLDVSRIQAGKLEFQLQVIDLLKVVREVVEEQRSMHPERDIRLRLPEHQEGRELQERHGRHAGHAGHGRRESAQGREDMAAPVLADPDRLDQVLINFLTNALKYSAGDQPVEVQLTRDAGEGADARPSARVAVQDWGPGIPPEELEHLWERFHRVKGIEVQSGSGVGLGIGLYIARGIVERHDGTLGVSSTVGEGSTFWFALPLVEPAAAE
jgi:signal transduction histidine kinase